MTSEIYPGHLEGFENGILELKEAVTRAQKLGEAARAETESSTQRARELLWTKAVEEAVIKIRGISENIREMAEASLGAGHKATATAEGTAKATDEVTQVLVRESERLIRQAEEIEKAAKDAAETSLRAFQGGLRQVGEGEKIARKAAETAGEMSQKASERAEESARGAKSLAADATKKAEAMGARIEKTHQDTVAEVGRFATKAEEALRMATEALERVKGLASSLLTQWESVVLILAVITAAVCFSLGVALMGR